MWDLGAPSSQQPLQEAKYLLAYWLWFFVALSVDHGGLIAVGDHWRSLYVPWQFVYEWSLVASEPMLSECAQLFISRRGCEMEYLFIFCNDAAKSSTYDPRRKEDALGEC